MTKYKIQVWGYLKQFEINTSTLDVNNPEQLHRHLLKHSRAYVNSNAMQNQVIRGYYTINVPAL